MSRPDDDARDLRPLLAAMPGFQTRDDKQAGADAFDAIARGIGLKSGDALKPVANDNKPAVGAPVARPIAVPVTAEPAAAVATAPKAAPIGSGKPPATQSTGNYFWISGSAKALQYVQEKLGLPSENYRAKRPNANEMRAWALPAGLTMDAAMGRSILAAGASGFGRQSKLPRDFKPFGARAGEPLSAAVIERLRKA